MVRVELDPYERGSLIEYLKYAKEQKELNRPKHNPNLKGGGMKFDTTDYDISRIEHLIEQIENPQSRTNIYKPAQYTEYVSRENKKKEEERKKEMEGLIEIL